MPDEANHGDGISGHPVVRPAKIVEQSYFMNWNIWLIRLMEEHAHVLKHIHE